MINFNLVVSHVRYKAAQNCIANALYLANQCQSPGGAAALLLYECREHDLDLDFIKEVALQNKLNLSGIFVFIEDKQDTCITHRHDI
jgi:hypothetical protein